MSIWVDADACPNVIKEILFRAAERKKIVLILVANHIIRVPRSDWIKAVQVESGFDMADHYIIQNLTANDLVITADILLADAVITQGGTALNPRGELYSIQNIKQRVAMRNLSEELRTQGLVSSSQAALSQKEVRLFASRLEQWLAKS